MKRVLGYIGNGVGTIMVITALSEGSENILSTIYRFQSGWLVYDIVFHMRWRTTAITRCLLGVFY